MPFSNSPNHFLASLSSKDGELLRTHLRPMKLPLGVIFYRAEDIIDRVYFPSSGVVSLIVGVSSGQFVEAGMFGRNSVIGASALLDGSVALNQAIGQAEGSGMVGERSALKGLVDRSETLRKLLAAYEQAIFAHVQQVAACNTVHELEARLCRWLLQVRDLIQSDSLPLTQEFLSEMLGVQRSSVTLVARSLQSAGLISYRRGHIQILDLEGLREATCECYNAINSHYQRLTGWTPELNKPPSTRECA
ncbi:cyclic nucleotide-binding protein [Methylocella silvestris BL2]|uniref:Cyclic nucleotide-binding protein n=1 Tax=Methylocella silvestris (strain DSM 15510 / CIP 108128 / LMG 27833 / NCIMB 13906 / BL2) TaxID=395965 RepID=B8EJD4_METSB|nr:Crp/Fnr family transcriptional regulator [Methylocella silvestris]ACK52626.1 cyclic nucleotide-binding protein [Methylocella silvestris BL2]